MKYVLTFVVGGIIGAVVGALWIGPERMEVGGLSDEDVAAIRATIESVVQTTAAKDWTAWESNWTEDAMTMYAHGPVTEGRAAVRQSWESENITEFAATPSVIEGRDGLAYARGTYSITVSTDAMPEPVTDNGKFLLILEKQPDGSWAIAIDAASSDLPLP
jgi:ketosteroid isomerase-like protein